MKNILWISRHPMTEEQTEDMKRIYGHNIIVTQYDGTITNLENIKIHVENADVIAAVLPCELLCKLYSLASGKPVIQSVSLRIPTGKMTVNANGREEPEYKFKHKCWQQLVKADIQFINL